MDHLRCNRFNPQLDLCHKTLEEKTSGSRGRILASCPFATYVRVVGVQVRDKCGLIYTKFSLTRPAYEASVFSILWATLGLLCLLPTLVWPAIEMQDGSVGYVNFVSYHVRNKRKTCLNQTFCDKGPDAKVGNVWGLNHNCSDWSHLLLRFQHG